MKQILHFVFLLFTTVLIGQVPLTRVVPQIVGKYDFTAIGNTLNVSANPNPCELLPQSSATLNLQPNETFFQAHMYWSASGPADDTVSLNGNTVIAQRTYSINNNFGLYNTHYADVTNLVGAIGNGVYTFSDYLGTIPCGNSTNYGGWMIYIIFGEPTLPQNQISIFEGFDYVSGSNPNLDITLTGIDVATDDLAKIGFLAWEGDASIAVQETLTINGNLIDNPPLNPGDNAFNGTNSYTNSSTLWNMDLDVYDLQGIVQPGDTQIDIQLTSGQDLVLVNNVITSVNSEIPDAACTIDDLDVVCDNGQNLFIDYTVYNLPSTSPLSAGTRVDFYWQNVGGGPLNYLDTVFTVNDIPIGGQESGNTILSIVGTPPQFDLVMIVDPANSILEIDETNNENRLFIDTTQPFSIGPDVESCAGLTVTLDTGVSSPDFTWQWYKDGNIIPGATNPSITVGLNGVYTVEGFEGPCFITDDIEVTFNLPPDAFPPADLFLCDDGATAGSFDLTENDDDLLGGQDPALFFVKYYETLQDAQDDTNVILVPTGYFISQPSPQTIYARVESPEGCFAIDTFKIFFTRVQAGQPEGMEVCDNDGDGFTAIDLPLTFDSEVLDGEPAADYLITYHNDPVEATTGANALPVPYNVPVPGETIFARLVNFDDLNCFDVVQIPIIVNAPPVPGAIDTYVVCDADNDGFAEFDLSELVVDLQGGNGDLLITFHGTQLDAQNGVLPLISPYPNDDIYNDSVWARVESSLTGCYTAVEVFLEVRDYPIATQPEEPLRECDDALADGFTVFDLTVVESEVLGTLDPLEYDIYYYELESDAIAAGDLALTAPDFSQAIANPGAYQNITNPQTIYILVVGNAGSTSPNNGTAGCYDIVTLELIVDPLPLDLGPFELFLCDDQASGSTIDEVSIFDLTQINDTATGGDSSITVTWYATPGDEAADTPIATPEAYANTVTPQTIVGRLESAFGCRTLVTMTLTVLPNPTPVTPTPLEVCDDDLDGGSFDDGFATFVLTDKDAEITDGEPDVSVTYYETLAQAEAGTPALTSPWVNTIPGGQVIYARVERDVPPGILGCFSIVELELIVVPLPDAPTADFIDPMFVCDDDGDGLAEFDLTLNDPFVLGTQDPIDFAPITYHESLAAAQTGTPFIATPEAYLSGGGTVWVRLESLDTGCYRITSFGLVTGTLPTIGSAEDLYLCDDEIGGSDPFDGLSTFDLTVNTLEVTLGDPTYSVSYYATQQDQIDGNPIATPEAYQNVISPVQEIFVTVFGPDSCPAVTSFFINVEANPTINIPTPLIVCDDNNNGFYNAFDLTSKDAELLGGQVDVSVRYYETLVDANLGDPADQLLSPYENIVPFVQTIYARLENDVPPGVNACFSIVPLELRIESLPLGVDLALFQDPLVACDFDGDGFEVFDLTQNNLGALGANEPLSDYSVSYYVNQGDADLGINAIATPGAYTNIVTPIQEVYVRVESFVTGCGKVTPFDLLVEPPADLSAGPFEMVLCDDQIGGSAPDDGVSTFDLTLNDPIITGGDPTYTVVYYASLQDQIDDNPIADPTDYQNVVNPQDIYVTVLTSGGCGAETFLTLRVLPNPSPVTPTPLVVCDGAGDPVIDFDPEDGFSTFILTDKDAEIIGGEPNVSVLYYATFDEAEAGVAGTELVSPYANTTAFSQVVYARVTKDVPPATLGCYSIVELELVVSPLPVAQGLPEDLYYCAVDNGGVGVFDLTQNDPLILGDLDPLVYVVLYFRTLTEAQNGVNPIGNPTLFASTTSPQTVYAGLIAIDTGCYTPPQQDPITFEVDLSFELYVKEGAFAGTPDPYMICDNLAPSDGLAEFTLIPNAALPTDLDPQAQLLVDQILQDQDPSVYVLTFHETLSDAELGIGNLPDVYTNITNPQVIYARVSNLLDPTDDPICYGIAEVLLSVEQLPPMILEDEYRICVDAQGNAIMEDFGAASPPTLETGLPTEGFTFLWSLNGAILPNEVGPSLVALAPGSYSVLVTELASGCALETVVAVNPSSPPLEYNVRLLNGAFAGEHVIEATATGLGTYQFSLDGGNLQDSGVFENVTPGTHQVTITNVEGCGSVTVDIGVVDYPRFVTPNNDGFNDTWNIIGLADYDPAARIYIFDRYGKLLKQLSPTAAGWDGTYKGNPLPSSDYWFRIEYTEEDIPKAFTGHFTLKR